MHGITPPQVAKVSVHCGRPRQAAPVHGLCKQLSAKWSNWGQTLINCLFAVVPGELLWVMQWPKYLRINWSLTPIVS